MSNIIGTKYTARELKQIDFYNRIKSLNKLNISFKAIKDKFFECFWCFPISDLYSRQVIDDKVINNLL